MLVLVQSCNHCPYVLAWEDRLNAIQREYADRGVRDRGGLLERRDDRYPGDSFENMVEHGRAVKGYDVRLPARRGPVDPHGRSATERTPEVFVFDGERRLRYDGAIDDDRDEHAVATRFLRDALDAVLAGASPR